jgi:HEAT repeat protein
MIPTRVFALVVLVGASACARRPAESLVKQLRSPHPETRIKGAEGVLAKKPPAAEVLPALTDAFRDPRAKVYTAAARATLSLGDPGVDALARLLSDKDAWVRCRAAETLGLARPVASRAVPQLLRALEDHDFCVTGKSVDALGVIGAPAVPGLLELLKDNNPAIRRNAGDALGKMPLDQQSQAVEILLPDFKDKDEFTRGEAAMRLTGMGRVAVPVFLAALHDGDVDLKLRSLDGLEEVGDTRAEVVNTLMETLADPARTVRLRSSAVLGRLGQKDEKLAERLLPLLQSKDTKVLHGVISALGDMGAAGAVALPDLIRLMDTHSETAVRSEAAEALFKMGLTESITAAERRNMEEYRRNNAP